MLNLKGREIHLCVVCGERDPENFYAHAKTLCKKCYKERVTNTRRERKRAIRGSEQPRMSTQAFAEKWERTA